MRSDVTATSRTSLTAILTARIIPSFVIFKKPKENTTSPLVKNRFISAVKTTKNKMGFKLFKIIFGGILEIPYANATNKKQSA